MAKKIIRRFNMKVAEFKDTKPRLRYDRAIWLSEAHNRFSQKWKNKKRSWAYLLSLISSPEVTRETYKDFLAMPKADQDNIKDVGGFVAGVLEGGVRSKTSVKSREVITLDLDSAPVGFWEDYTLTIDHACAYYTTHKHSPDKPRLRLLIPLSREVTPEEYEAVARWLASDIGMSYMDPTTFQPSRLMYWPSVSSDGEFKFDYIDASMINPDDVLANYSDWHDQSQWPLCDGEVKQRDRAIKKVGDPKEKKGVIGAFCRAYSIQEAIAAFIPDVYSPTEKEDRYTYVAGSSAGGLVIYGDVAYSNHSTDPASGQALNAFDIVRIHKFDAVEDDETKPVNQRASYKAMIEFAGDDKAVCKELARDKIGKEEFDDSEDDWMTKFAYDKNGAIEKSLQNLKLIFDNDQSLQGIAFNELADMKAVRSSVPWDRRGMTEYWTDTDDHAVSEYITLKYREFKDSWLEGQVVLKAQKNRYHPIKEYFEGLYWDGVKRIDTMLIDLMGAADNAYVREIAAKTLIAAVKRTYEPGCKFDTVLVLSGPQGCGKSTLASKLGMNWFSDSLTFEDMKSKEGYEKLRGNLILELSELKGMKKTDFASSKNFISAQQDHYRPAYGRNTRRCPRQCIFIGTVNGEDGYLRDPSGNRRYWPVDVINTGKVFDLTQDDIDQLWAEAYERYKNGERNIVLSKEAEKFAETARKNALEKDDRVGLVEAYLERKLPYDWDTRDLDERLDFLRSDEKGAVERTQVCTFEIWAECLGHYNWKDAKKNELDEVRSILRALGWGSKRTIKTQRHRIYGSIRPFKKED